MKYEFYFPELGEGLFEGYIVAYLVKEGEYVVEDQPLVEVQTDKVTTVLPSPVAGVVDKLPYRPGDVVTVNDVILVIVPGEGEEAAHGINFGSCNGICRGGCNKSAGAQGTIKAE